MRTVASVKGRSLDPGDFSRAQGREELWSGRRPRTQRRDSVTRQQVRTEGRMKTAKYRQVLKEVQFNPVEHLEETGTKCPTPEKTHSWKHCFNKVLKQRSWKDFSLYFGINFKNFLKTCFHCHTHEAATDSLQVSQVRHLSPMKTQTDVSSSSLFFLSLQPPDRWGDTHWSVVRVNSMLVVGHSKFKLCEHWGV